MVSKVEAINKHSGEVIELAANTPIEITQAYLIAAEYEKVATSLKDQLKKLLPNAVDEQGKTPEVNGYIIRKYESQRMNYNKQALREVFDEDELDLFLEVSKGKVDKYIKENELSDDQIYRLKQGLEPSGNVISSFKKERVL